MGIDSFARSNRHRVYCIGTCWHFMWCFLPQGEDVVHDAIRQQQVEAGVPALIAGALSRFEGQNEEVLWAALFSLAVLVREGGDPYTISTSAAVEAGLLPLLQTALKNYEVSVCKGY